MQCNCMKEVEEDFPLCKKYNQELFDDVCHHMLIMGEASKKINIPMEELIEFFYKGKLKIDLIREQEEELRLHEQGDAILREVSQDNGLE